MSLGTQEPRIFKEKSIEELMNRILNLEQPRQPQVALLSSLASFIVLEEEKILTSQKIQKGVKEVDIKSQGGNQEHNADSG